MTKCLVNIYWIADFHHESYCVRLQQGARFHPQYHSTGPLSRTLSTQLSLQINLWWSLAVNPFPQPQTLCKHLHQNDSPWTTASALTYKVLSRCQAVHTCRMRQHSQILQREVHKRRKVRSRDSKQDSRSITTTKLVHSKPDSLPHVPVSELRPPALGPAAESKMRPESLDVQVKRNSENHLNNFSSEELWKFNLATSTVNVCFLNIHAKRERYLLF